MRSTDHATRLAASALLLGVLLLVTARPVPALAIHYSKPTDGHTFAYQQGYFAGEANCAAPGRPTPDLTNNSNDFKQGYNDGCTAAQKQWQYNQGYQDGHRACVNQGALQAPPRGPLDYARGFMQGCRDALQGRPAGNPDNPQRGERTVQGVEVAEIRPNQGPEAGGTRVQIQGRGFTGATSVAFGQERALDFRVDSDTQITATVPPGTPGSQVDVTVVNVGRVTAVGGGTTLNGYALQSDGTVWAWGQNRYGQLGNGTNADSSGPVQVMNLTGVVAVAAGSEAAYALKTDGTVWAWGNNGSFSLGDEYGNRNRPVPVGGLSGVTAVAAASGTAYARKADGTVWAWGSSTEGRLGNGSTGRDSPAPVPVASLSDVTALAAHFGGGYALKADGTVWAWGSNAGGQLGRGWPHQSGNSSTPVRVRGLTGVTDIAGGVWSGYALKDDGTVWAWGNNSRGELGIGRTWDAGTGTGQYLFAEPVQVQGLSAVRAIAAGQYRAYALKRDGTVWAWGQFGQTYDYAPAQVPGLQGVAAIYAGEFTAFALKPDGTVWAWGEGKGSVLVPGSLGRTPVRVATLDPEPVANQTGPQSRFTYLGQADKPDTGPGGGPGGDHGGGQGPDTGIGPGPGLPPPPGDTRNGVDCGSLYVPTYMKRQAGCPGYGEPTVAPPPVEPPPTPTTPTGSRNGVDCDSFFVPNYMKRQAGCPGYGGPTPAPPDPDPAPPPVQSTPVPDTRRSGLTIFGIDCDSPEIPRLWKVLVGCPDP